MKWIGISGSWRQGAPGLAEDVRREVSAVLERGDAIVTGGALGVDFLATDVVLAAGLDEDRLKVILPTKLPAYEAAYRLRVREGVANGEAVDRLMEQLREVKRIGALREMRAAEPNVKSYSARNLEVVKACDELLAFWVKGSPGTKNTIEHARAAGKPVKIYEYTNASDTA